MIHNTQEFEERLRSDRAFRQRILAARKAGTLAETLRQEGCAFDLSLLAAQLPRVRTGILAGVHSNATSCYCGIISEEQR